MPAKLREWTDEERETLAAEILDGRSIEEAAARISARGKTFIPGPEAVKEVMRHYGLLPFIATYGKDVTRQRVAKMQDLFHASRGDSVRGGLKQARLQANIARLAAMQVDDAEVVRRYHILLRMIGQERNPGIVPLVYVIRGATCSEADSIRHESGETIPTISLRFELPMYMPTAELREQRKAHMLLLAHLTNEMAALKEERGALYAALRRAGARRLKLFIVKATSHTSETTVVGESVVLREQKLLE